MRFSPIPLVSLAVALLVAPAASAQATAPTQVDFTPWGNSPRITIEPGWTDVPTPWRVSYGNQVTGTTPADGKATLTWTLQCDGHDLRLRNATTPVPFQPGQAEATGTAVLQLQAAAGTVGMEALPCLLGAVFSETAGVAGANVTLPVAPVVDFVDGLQVTLPVDSKRAGPQKQIPFEIEVANAGNSRVEMGFEWVSKPGGRWNVLLPERLVLEPGSEGTAILTVATPFHNGYNSGSGTFTVNVTSAAASDPTVKGSSQVVEAHATTKGWYVPGPSPLLLVAALAAVVLVLRRRA